MKSSWSVSSVHLWVSFWNPTIFNTICWLAGLMGQTIHWPSVWCSKHYFFHMQFLIELGHSNLFIFMKMNWHAFFQRVWREIMTKKKYLENQTLADKSFVKSKWQRARYRWNLHEVSICTRILKYRVWKIEFDELGFLSISNSNFAGYTGSKNLVQTRQKFQLIKLDFSNSTFQNPSADRYQVWLNVNSWDLNVGQVMHFPRRLLVR